MMGRKSEGNHRPKKECNLLDWNQQHFTQLLNTITTTLANLYSIHIMGLYWMSAHINPIVQILNWLNCCSADICPDDEQADLAFGPKICLDWQLGSIRIIRGPFTSASKRGNHIPLSIPFSTSPPPSTPPACPLCYFSLNLNM